MDIINEFFNKVLSLNENDKLTCTFGNANYEAYKELNKVVIKQTKYLMYKSDETVSSSTPEILKSQLINSERCQKWYATNAFTGKIQFLDNWGSFLKSFN